jgi:hypothetical protein
VENDEEGAYVSCPGVRNFSVQSGHANLHVSRVEGVMGDWVVADAGVVAEEGEEDVGLSGAVEAKLESVFAEPGVVLDCGLEIAFWGLSEELFCGDEDVAFKDCSSGRPLIPAIRLYGTEILGTDARLSTMIPFTDWRPVGMLELPTTDGVSESVVCSWISRWARCCNTSRFIRGMEFSRSDSKNILLLPNVGSYA